MEIASLTPALEELERMLRWAAGPTGIPAEHRIVPARRRPRPLWNRPYRRTDAD